MTHPTPPSTRKGPPRNLGPRSQDGWVHGYNAALHDVIAWLEAESNSDTYYGRLPFFAKEAADMLRQAQS